MAVSPKDQALVVVVTTADTLLVCRAGKTCGALTGLAYTPTAVHIHPDGERVAVGAAVCSPRAPPPGLCPP